MPEKPLGLRRRLTLQTTEQTQYPAPTYVRLQDEGLHYEKLSVASAAVFLFSMASAFAQSGGGMSGGPEVEPETPTTNGALRGGSAKPPTGAGTGASTRLNLEGAALGAGTTGVVTGTGVGGRNSTAPTGTAGGNLTRP